MSYYRASRTYLGTSPVIKPTGHYEGVDKNGDPEISFGSNDMTLFHISDILETAASKYIGGAILGAFSMFRNEGTILGPVYLYQINDKPDVDISHWDMQDFAHLEEVRYRKPVKATFIGSYTYTPTDRKKFGSLYEVVGNEDPYHEVDPADFRAIKNIKQYLATKASQLNPAMPTRVPPQRLPANWPKKRIHTGIKAL